MSNTDLLSDDEVIEVQTRDELLTSGALGVVRKLRGMILRPPTMESMSYLWELKNYFVYRDNDGKVARNNPVIGVAEFVYVHHADIDEVAEVISDKAELRKKLREYINGPLSGFQTLGDAMPIIESMLTDYAAAQSEIDGTAKGAGQPRGKGQARAGKRHTSHS
jgi:hypothetical protein